MRHVSTCALILALATAASTFAQKSASASDEAESTGPLDAKTFSGLAFRSLGPAITSGRIADIAIPPSDPYTWYLAVASGGVNFDGPDTHAEGEQGRFTLDLTGGQIRLVGDGRDKARLGREQTRIAAESIAGVAFQSAAIPPRINP